MRNYTRRTNVPFSWDVLVARNTTQLSSPHETGILARSAFSRILTKLVKYLRSTSAGGRAPKSRGFRYWRPSAHAVYNNSQNQAFEGGCFNHLSRLLGSPDPRLFGALHLSTVRQRDPLDAADGGFPIRMDTRPPCPCRSPRRVQRPPSRSVHLRWRDYRQLLRS
jgi:hypothetical protein